MGMAACGFSYNGFDKKKQQPKSWDRAKHINIIQVEFNIFKGNIYTMLNNWNISTHHWLKYYTYIRLTPPNQKPTTKARLITFCVSAFWHGFYPGYYVFFVSLNFIQDITTGLRRRLRKYFVVQDKNKKEHPGPYFKYKYIYDILGFILTKFIVSHVAAAFLLLSFESTFTFYKSMYFSGFICMILFTCLFSFVIPLKKPATVVSDEDSNPKINKKLE